jgi:hypothetical protein
MDGPRLTAPRVTRLTTTGRVGGRRAHAGGRSLRLSDVAPTRKQKDLRRKAARLKRRAELARARREESNKRLDQAIMTLRELSGRA